MCYVIISHGNSFIWYIKHQYKLFHIIVLQYTVAVNFIWKQCGIRDFLVSFQNNTFPKPPALIFLIDVSYNNIKSGLVQLLCGQIKEIVKLLPKDEGAEKSNMRVGFITYNNTVHFYNIKVRNVICENVVSCKDNLLTYCHVKFVNVCGCFQFCGSFYRAVSTLFCILTTFPFVLVSSLLCSLIFNCLILGLPVGCLDIMKLYWKVKSIAYWLCTWYI